MMDKLTADEKARARVMAVPPQVEAMSSAELKRHAGALADKIASGLAITETRLAYACIAFVLTDRGETVPTGSAVVSQQLMAGGGSREGHRYTRRTFTRR